MPLFRDRREAGRRLARRLAGAHYPDPVVLALPRGGVPVAFEVATALDSPLDLLLVRKIGVPGQSELAAAAIVDGETPEIVFNPVVMELAGLTRADLAATIAAETRELERRRQRYLAGRPRAPIAGRTVILVDDGLATGTTVRAALAALRRQHPAAIVVAVPVAPPDTVAELAGAGTDVVCLEQPEPFHGIGLHYDDFDQLADADVTALLDAAAQRGPVASRSRP